MGQVVCGLGTGPWPRERVGGSGNVGDPCPSTGSGKVAAPRPSTAQERSPLDNLTEPAARSDGDVRPTATALAAVLRVTEGTAVGEQDPIGEPGLDLSPAELLGVEPCVQTAGGEE